MALRAQNSLENQAIPLHEGLDPVANKGFALRLHH